MPKLTFMAARLENVVGERVTGDRIKLLDGVSFAVYPVTQTKNPRMFNWSWYVVELTTGQSVGSGYTRAEAVKDARTELKRVGARKFKQLLKKQPVLNPL